MERVLIESQAMEEGHCNTSPREWLRFLPEEWRGVIEEPLYILHHREYEMDASRCVGYDGEDRPCFTSHHFVLAATTGRQPGHDTAEAAYGEELAAWRLRDDRWLVYRAVSGTAATLPRGFYAISPDMPR